VRAHAFGAASSPFPGTARRGGSLARPDKPGILLFVAFVLQSFRAPNPNPG